MEELRALRLKGYVDTKIVGMRHHYKDNDGHRLPNPMPGCPVSLQLEPSNPYHCNAIKVINKENNRHLGYIIREIADLLSLILKDNSSVAARGIISTPRHRYLSPEVINCQILLFFAAPLELIPPLPPHLNFRENLTRPDFMLISSPFAYIGCTVEDYDSYVAHNIDPLPLQPQVEQPLTHPCSTNAESPRHVHDGDATVSLNLAPKFQTQVEQPLTHPCSTNAESPRHVHDGDATVPLNLSPKFQTQSQTQTQAEIQGTGQNSEVTCMKCKQMGGSLNIAPKFQTQVEQPLAHPCSTNTESPRHVHDDDATVPLNLSPKFQTQSQTQTQAEIQGTGQNSEVTCMKCKQMGCGPFFQCIQSRCPLLIHESCIVGVVGRTCLFCLFLARRGELLRAKKGSDLYKTLKEKYREARKRVAHFFGTRTFVRLRELAGLEPLVPVPVQAAYIVNMQCHTEGRVEEAAGKSTIIEKDDEREKKEKTVGRGKRRLPPRPSLHRACKARTQASASM